MGSQLSCFSIVEVDRLEVGTDRRYGDNLLMMAACVFVEDKKILAGKLVDFGDVRH